MIQIKTSYLSFLLYIDEYRISPTTGRCACAIQMKVTQGMFRRSLRFSYRLINSFAALDLPVVKDATLADSNFFSDLIIKVRHEK